MKSIIVLGTWSSGSGAVHDYLASRNDIISPFGPNEFKICAEPMGLHFLYNNCFKNGNYLLNPAYAFSEFRKYVNGFYQHKHYMKKGLENKIFDRHFLVLTENFIKNITFLKYYGLPHYANCSLSKFQKIYLKIMVRIFKKKIKDLKPTSIILTKNEKIFISEAKKYIYSILKYYCKNNIQNKTIVLNNAADVTDPINSSQYFENRKILIVTRDPRDIFSGMKTREANSAPWYNVDTFINWYQQSFGNKQFRQGLNNKIILKVKFEKFVKNFDKENKRICKFLGIKEKYVFKDVPYKFNLKQSLKNIGKSKRFLSPREITLIEKKLKPYLQW